MRRGEKRYIFPYQENADVMFNSALVYELSALKPLAEPLLRQVPSARPNTSRPSACWPSWNGSCRWIRDLIPDNSILREFIGGSILNEFKPWKGRDQARRGQKVGPCGEAGFGANNRGCLIVWDRPEGASGPPSAVSS